MKVLLFGATGMVGQGVLRACLADPGVDLIVAIGRTPTGVQHPKLRDLVHADLWHYDAIESQLSGFDACFFCLGVSSNGMTEPDYERITYGITAAAAETLCRLNPEMTFVFVSGLGADSSGKGSVMWARIKGKAENAVLQLPFRGAYVFRPGFIQPLDGIQSRTRLYRVLYVVFKPLMPILRAMLPNQVLTTRQIGAAMLAAARHGYEKPVLESRDIRVLSQR